MVRDLSKETHSKRLKKGKKKREKIKMGRASNIEKRTGFRSGHSAWMYI